MFTFLKRLILRRKARAARFEQWERWQRELKLRTDEQFRLRWAAEGLPPAQAQAIADIARIMELPSP